jgi:hypothetical protein
LKTLISDFEISFLILFLESPAGDTATESQLDPLYEGDRAQADRGVFPVSAAGGLGHLDPGLPGVETDLACAPTSAGGGTVPHRQVDLFFLIIS